MTKNAREVACWRVWYYLEQHGSSWETAIRANANIGTELFDHAIDTLVDLDVVAEVAHSDIRDESKYITMDSEPPLLAVFPGVGTHD